VCTYIDTTDSEARDGALLDAQNKKNDRDRHYTVDTHLEHFTADRMVQETIDLYDHALTQDDKDSFV
jgi:hypothetical protein